VLISFALDLLPAAAPPCLQYCQSFRRRALGALIGKLALQGKLAFGAKILPFAAVGEIICAHARRYIR
jgi:hypothetical protein